MKAPAQKLRDHFLAWQCRVRQIAMRQDGGRPSPGMRPRVLDTAGREIAPALTVLIVPKDSAETTALFRFQVQKTSDPKDVYERGLALLQADYFQQPETFSDRLTALLPGGSTRVILDRGPFGCSRNPLYLGLIALDLALALLWPSFWAVVLVPVGIAALQWGAVLPEERYLSAKFGAEYDAYRHRTRRWC